MDAFINYLQIIPIPSIVVAWTVNTPAIALKAPKRNTIHHQPFCQYQIHANLKLKNEFHLFVFRILCDLKYYLPKQNPKGTMIQPNRDMDVTIQNYTIWWNVNFSNESTLY